MGQIQPLIFDDGIVGTDAYEEYTARKSGYHLLHNRTKGIVKVRGRQNDKDYIPIGPGGFAQFKMKLQESMFVSVPLDEIVVVYVSRTRFDNLNDTSAAAITQGHLSDTDTKTDDFSLDILTDLGRPATWISFISTTDLLEVQLQLEDETALGTAWEQPQSTPWTSPEGKAAVSVQGVKWTKPGTGNFGLTYQVF